MSKTQTLLALYAVTNGDTILIAMHGHKDHKLHPHKLISTA